METTTLIEKIKLSLSNTTETRNHLVKKLLLNDLIELKEKEFKAAKQELLNDKLDSLFGDVDFDNIDPKKLDYINKKRIELRKFLEKELFIIPTDYFRRISTVFGILFAFLFEVTNSDYLKTKIYSVFFLILGIAIANFFGYMIDQKIKKQNNSIKI